MKWNKAGKVFCPDNDFGWMVSHAANPVAEHVRDDLFRVYLNFRDKDNRSHIGFIEIDIKNPEKTLNISEKPVFFPGERGAFDDSGVSLGCINNIRGKKYLYYVGWNLGVNVPWINTIGLAVYDDENDAFVRVSREPVLGINDIDPFSLSYPWVMKDGDAWKMWYGSNTAWGKNKSDMLHVIKYAESPDGFNWDRKGHVAIDLDNPGERAFSRPCVIKEDGLYKMWYSLRGEAYRIGYAESRDGVKWERKDRQAGIEVSASGWDSEMIEYPFVFRHGGDLYMFYNGNDHGKTGFGLAVLE